MILLIRPEAYHIKTMNSYASINKYFVFKSVIITTMVRVLHCPLYRRYTSHSQWKPQKFTSNFQTYRFINHSLPLFHSRLREFIHRLAQHGQEFFMLIHPNQISIRGFARDIGIMMDTCFIWQFLDLWWFLVIREKKEEIM